VVDKIYYLDFILQLIAEGFIIFSVFSVFFGVYSL